MRENQVEEEAEALVQGKRELKKAALRATIVKVAHAQFEKHGFDNVTVAEIAHAAKISVKTLFQYFRSKEDIVFEGEFDLRDRLVVAINTRKKKVSIIKACATEILHLINEDLEDSLSKLEGFDRMTGNAVLQARLQMMWLRYEEALASTISKDVEAIEADARPRLVAIQIVSILRMLTSEEPRLHLKNQRVTRTALHAWVEGIVVFLSKGIKDYGVRK